MADSEIHSPEDGGLTTRAVPPELKVLHNEDLLIHVLSFFDPKFLFPNVGCQLKSSTRKALLFACLTCKSFFKPASDLLWRYMTSLTPLFKILPKFVKVNDFYMFPGVIQTIHMERFRVYARKIRGLEIRTCPESIGDHFIHRLLIISYIQPFFPALTAVHLSAPYDLNAIENYAPLLLLHGNLLSKISLSSITSQNESLISSFLLHLSDKATALHQLTLDGILSHDILGFLKSFRRLQYVSLWFHASSSPITASFLQDLRDLPDLHHLGLGVNMDMHDSPSMIREGTKGFQALNSLYIGGLSTSVRKILQCFPVAPGLKRILWYLQAPTWASVQGCIAEMCCIGPNVKSFALSVNDQIVGPMPAHSSTNSLSPFIYCRQLTSLTLDVVLPTNLDESIRCLCENGAWQNMQTLELRPPVYSAHSTASSTSLRILAQSCPKLMDITIPIDFTLHNPSSLQQEYQHPRTPHHPLKELFISQQGMINHTSNRFFSTQMAGHVARFLEHYFPNLVGGCCLFQTHDKGDFQWWTVVKMVMEQVSSVRAAEKESTVYNMSRCIF